MQSDQFRRMALSLPDVTEFSHMAHPDFRVNGKIFATLEWPDESWGMVKLSPEEQRYFIQTYPNVFVPVKGAWGLQGSTNVRLSAAETPVLEEAMTAAWKKARSVKSRPRRARS
ncbi:MAG TPA: MmcQ/YjbR family DNA-binding protein [Bryobacteraceae bacterium]|jgi:hypothetical protein|nr:MmcQ/YjbR family DNA-binding protein [Bryobacteraceae bacterium]